MKKVFLDELPRYIEGRYKGKINWSGSIGCNVPFVYGDIEGKLKIINYYKINQYSYLDIKYDNKTISIYSGGLQKGAIGKLLPNELNKKLKTPTSFYKYNVGDIIKTNTGKIYILEHTRISSGKYDTKGYKYICLIDNNIDYITESNLISGKGCNVCSGKKIIKGYNDLHTTHPQIAKLLKYSNKGYELTYGSNKINLFICPNCKYEKHYKIINIINFGFSCPQCGDGISYPNKFVRAFLEQINEDYTPEYSPEWANGKRYDNYLINRNEIWEIHGIQHYEESFKDISIARTLKEEQDNDKMKKELAEQNGYKYVVIDARESNIDYIKNSILNLSEIQRYNSESINWLKCHEYACSSLVKTACDLWNNGIKNTLEISKIIKLARGTIIRYLKQGYKLNWCDYNPKIIMKTNGNINGKRNAKPIVQLSLINQYIKEFESALEAARQLNVSHSSISACCNNQLKQAHGFKWMYKKDYDNFNCQ